MTCTTTTPPTLDAGANSQRAERPRGLRRCPRIVIVGGGVAALEALLALRSLLDGHASIDMVAPNSEFVYRPLAVAEPFGLVAPHCFDLAGILAEQQATLHRGVVETVDANRGLVRLHGGGELPYDGLLIAPGARPCEWLAGAVPFAGPQDVPGLRMLLGDLDRGAVSSIAFAAPPALTWTLPLYELALLTAARVGERRLAGVQLCLVTPEAQPLEIFGPAAARHVREVLANRGITLKTGTRARRFVDGHVELDPGGRVAADRVIALPVLRGQPIAGLPADPDGFVEVDDHGAVADMQGVFAAGDGTTHWIKQGGIAAQQADAAAEAIAAQLGGAVEPRPFRPMLRGQLLTGLGPSYLTAGEADSGRPRSTVTSSPLWWPPSKIAGRYLAPYLAGREPISAPAELRDRDPISTPPDSHARDEREAIRGLAVDLAESDADWGDYRSALTWLDAVEQLDGLLPAGYPEKQADWQRRARAHRTGA